MSDTMSSSSSDWAQLYHLNDHTGAAPMAAAPHDATAVATTATSAAALSPEGRVSKPPRRRRASRAAPTTLLNTDTTNFRAMVQQFTGVPSAAFTFGSTGHNQMGGPSLNFGLASQQQQQQQHVGVGVGVGPHQQSGYGYINNSNGYQLQQQQQQRFYSQQQYVFPFNSGGGEHIVGFGSDGGGRANSMDGYVMDHGHGHGHGHHHPDDVFHHGSSSDGRTTNAHGYNL